MAMRVQTKSKKSTGGSRNTNRNSSSYNNDTYPDEGSDDEGAISLAAIKNKYKKGANIVPSKGELFVFTDNSTIKYLMGAFKIDHPNNFFSSCYPS